MSTEKTIPSTPHPDQDPVETMLSRLPEAYAAWERGANDPDLERLQRRVGELLREGEVKSAAKPNGGIK